MKIASWNINGIKARHDVLIAWLKQEQPDIVCLQEIKSMDEVFPGGEIEALGYNVETHGQKGFNGVAICSKLPFDEVNRGLPMLAQSTIEDPQARFIEGVFSFNNKVLRVISLYLPNGNPVDDPRKFEHKLEWMDRLHDWARSRLDLEEAFILAGDYNVIPQNEDCWDPTVWQGDALFSARNPNTIRGVEESGFDRSAAFIK